MYIYIVQVEHYTDVWVPLMEARGCTGDGMTLKSFLYCLHL